MAKSTETRIAVSFGRSLVCVCFICLFLFVCLLVCLFVRSYAFLPLFLRFGFVFLRHTLGCIISDCLCSQGGMTEETRSMLALPELTEPPMKPYLNPFPPKGRVYDYKFVKEVGT